MSRTHKDSKTEKQRQDKSRRDPDFAKNKPRGGMRNLVREAEGEEEEDLLWDTRDD